MAKSIPKERQLKWSYVSMCMCANLLHSCLTLCEPVDCSPPGSSPVRGILQARILEWVAITCLRGSSWPSDRNHVSCFQHLQAGSLPLATPGGPIYCYFKGYLWWEKVQKILPVLQKPTVNTIAHFIFVL